MSRTKHRIWSDASLYVAVAPIAAALMPHEVKAWIHANPAALGPLMVWLASHHYLLGKKLDNCPL